MFPPVTSFPGLDGVAFPDAPAALISVNANDLTVAPAMTDVQGWLVCDLSDGVARLINL